jgi:hypothetical protein
MSESKWNYSLLYFARYTYVEFECGGQHPLISNKKFSTDAETWLHKSLVNQILQDCPAFKIVFYQNIDHIIDESSEVLTPQGVKDILLSVYEKEFDSYRFRFFDRVNKQIKGYQIDFTPDNRTFYFSIEQDNISGGIKISLINKLGHDILSGHEKIEEFESILDYYGYHLSTPSKKKPSDACFVLHPSVDGNLVLSAMRESKYYITKK